MLLTETQAKARVCPLSIAGGINNCVGSACMAWRWAKARVSNGQTTQDKLVRSDTGYISFHTQMPEGHGWRREQRTERSIPGFTEWWRDAEPSEGFCGMAGAIETAGRPATPDGDEADFATTAPADQSATEVERDG